MNYLTEAELGALRPLVNGASVWFYVGEFRPKHHAWRDTLRDLAKRGLVSERFSSRRQPSVKAHYQITDVGRQAWREHVEQRRSA